MGAMASQITSFTIDYSTIYSGADQRKHQSSASLPVSGEFPAQMASNAENVSIRWRYHVVESTPHQSWYVQNGVSAVDSECMKHPYLHGGG